jgi:hypothetical protein
MITYETRVISKPVVTHVIEEAKESKSSSSAIQKSQSFKSSTVVKT